MKNKSILFSSVFLMCLSACSTNVRHDIKEYILETNYKDNYRILQLTDIHLSDKDNYQTHFDFMDLTIKEANPDMIIVTGDIFTFASKTTAKRLFKFLDSYNVPWTVTFGNHDEQCYFSVDWVTSVLNNYGSYCLFKDIQNDDVQGNANFAINLMQGDKVFEQLIIMDSNRYSFSEMGYDYFKKNQIEWYERLVDYTTEKNEGVVPSLMFYHIPLPEINNVWDDAQAKKDDATLIVGEKGEASCNPDYNSGFFEVIKAKRSTTGMYFGHDHINNFIVKYKVDDTYSIDFGYGVKATDRVYYEDAMLGGRVITLKNDHSVEYQDYYHTYKEVK